MKEMFNFAFEYVSCVVFFGIAFVSVYWHFIMFLGKEKYDPLWSFCLVVSLLMSMYIFNTYYTGKNEIKVITEYKEIKILIDAKDGTGTLTEITMRDFENEKKE